MRNAAIIALALSVLVLAPHARAADEMSGSDKALADKAVEFAKHWFSLVTAGDYAAAYAETTPKFQKNHSLEEWIKTNKDFTTKAGKLTGVDFSLVAWQRNTPDFPPGVYFQIYAYTQFEDIHCSYAVIYVASEDDGNFHIVNYLNTYLEPATEKEIKELQRQFDGTRFPTEKITKEEMDEYYAEIQALAGWRGFQKDNTYVFTFHETEGDTGYMFTMPGHPAHPAVVKVWPMVVQGVGGQGVAGHFAGDEAAYRKWLDSVVPRSSARTNTNDPSIDLLVDAIPSDAVLFYQQIDVKLPAEKLKEMSDAEIEQDIADTISSKLVPFAKEHDAHFVCLLPSKGEDMRAFAIPGSKTKLMLSMKAPAFVAVFYQMGHLETSPVSFSTGKPGAGRTLVSMSIGGKTLIVPPNTPISLFVYFNLTRIQGAAARAGSPEVFLETSGTGKTVPVIIPGMKEPLQVFESESVIKATWYADENKPETLHTWRSIPAPPYNH